MFKWDQMIYLQNISMFYEINHMIALSESLHSFLESAAIEVPKLSLGT